MINLKKGICPMCPSGFPETGLITGLCQMHYWQGRRQVSAAPLRRRGITKQPKPLRSIIKLISYQDEIKTLTQWYVYQISRGFNICENCGDTINLFGEHAMISAQAHIIPKNLFPSVAIHPFNILHLCNQYNTNNCHGRYDHSWAKAEKMEVFEIASHRFTLFMNDIAAQEHRKLPESLKTLLLCPKQ